ncbi:hypothetical protein J437_LFUL009165 [Ladona fulva]|uniref:Uncharacterized protein n=1 Tax=Ladona fulva TaxID=123851 RepID=A0A8K0K763_LADFU|nr:hypothetical protein J437_LFUL009165 [Ladona fulva]
MIRFRKICDASSRLSRKLPTRPCHTKIDAQIKEVARAKTAPNDLSSMEMPMELHRRVIDWTPNTGDLLHLLLYTTRRIGELRTPIKKYSKQGFIWSCDKSIAFYDNVTKVPLKTSIGELRTPIKNYTKQGFIWSCDKSIALYENMTKLPLKATIVELRTPIKNYTKQGFIWSCDKSMAIYENMTKLPIKSSIVVLRTPVKKYTKQGFIWSCNKSMAIYDNMMKLPPKIRQSNLYKQIYQMLTSKLV